MAFKDEDNFMVSKRLMKMIGFYQLANSPTIRLIGFNIMQFALIIQFILFCVICCLFSANIYYLNDPNDFMVITPYILYLVAGFLSLCKLYKVIKHSKLIWNCLKLTAIGHFIYQFHDYGILKIGRKRSKFFGILIIFLWSGTALLWISAPIIIKNIFINIKRGNTIYRYRHNIFNLVFPATDTFYNNNFTFYYIIESLLFILWVHCIVVYDFLVISLCIVMRFQIKTIGHSYSSFDISHTHIMNNKNLSQKQKEEILIHDLKILIQDHQHVMRNTISILRIFSPVMYVQVFVTSAVAIISWSITTMNYYNGVSIFNTLNYKVALSPTVYFYNLYLMCYLFDKLDEEKENMCFAIYCCNWEKRNVKFRKLIQLNMAIDRCNRMNIRLSEKKILNLVMFTSVVHMTYSILSVLIKSMGETEE